MEKLKPENSMSLPLTFLSTCDEEGYTILCLELDIASCGVTSEEAEESLKDLVQMYIEDSLARGENRVPLRPVSLDALLEFLGPDAIKATRPLTSRRLTVPVHADT